jgi:iron only hydrogenase large subunit-like protein
MKKRFSRLRFPLKGKYLIMLAPSFIADFDYPKIISHSRELGFDKVVEVTFGAKMINREYYKILNNSKELRISSTCPGIVDFIKKNYPEYKKNLIRVDSPMIAMGKICKKIYPNHKVVFLSPCNFKKIEASKSKFIDFVLDFKEFQKILGERKIKDSKKKIYFDKFYNDYTKVYPLSGGLTRTAHFRGLVKKKEVRILDGIKYVEKFLKQSNKEIRFLDCTFCKGGCIGGPFLSSSQSLDTRKKKVLDYLDYAKSEDIPETRKGLIERAEGINFLKKGFR